MKLKCTNAPRRIFNPITCPCIARVVIAVAIALLASLLHASPAYAAPEDHIVYPPASAGTGINNPANTTVDLFDYWITGQSDDDHDGNNGRSAGYTNWGGVVNEGINQNHALLFHGGNNGAHPSNSSADVFTGMTGDRPPSRYWGPVSQGIVSSSLGTDGYPVLNGQVDYSQQNPFITMSNGNRVENYSHQEWWGWAPFTRFDTSRGNSINYNESLNYLFNPATGEKVRNDSGSMDQYASGNANYVAGKASYPNVNGLFSVDDYGYYVYNSGFQSAHYNQSSNRFELGVQQNGANGFWPLDDLKGQNAPHNDYMGMHMKMEFSMPENGEVLNPQGEYVPMTFTFTGDDDVWVYIDGVLVGDVGGIHQPSSLQINFQTGEVLVNRDSPFDDSYKPSDGSDTHGSNPYSPEYVERTTLGALMGLDGDTFAAGTYHKIDFFYLERGNNESNLEIRFNMINTADFTAHKAKITQPQREPLLHDEFQFELTGFDGVYRRNETTGAVELKEGTENIDALKPKGATNYTTPQNAGNGDVSRSFRDEGDKWVYRVGVAADGNVNFGNADFMNDDLGNIYRYKVEEVLPADAVPQDDGTFKFTHLGTDYYCPRTVYYVQAEVKQDESDGSYYLSKRYFIDENYEIEYETSYASFHDYNFPLTPKKPSITAAKRLMQGETEIPLGAIDREYTFELTNADGSRVFSRATASSDGSVSFELPNITHADFVNHVQNGQAVYEPLERTYVIREVLPAGAIYNEGDETYTYQGVQYDRSTYTVTVTATYDPSSGTVSTPVITYQDGSAPTFTNRILPISVSAEKRWDDSAAGEGAAVSHPAITFRLYIAQNTAEEGEPAALEPTEERAKYADAGQTTAEDKVIDADATGEACTVTWTNLPKIDAAGQPIDYIVVEGTGTEDSFVAGAPTGYASELGGNEEDGYFVTNTLQPLSLVVNKKAGPAGQETNPLEGAGFTMTRLDPESDPLEPYAPEHDLFFEQVVQTGEDGKAIFGDAENKLYAGTYRISETTVPKGYQQAGDVIITIDANGNATIGGNDVTYDPATRTLSITITNTELPELPATGGPGDRLLLASGVTLIVAALTMLLWREGRLAE